MIQRIIRYFLSLSARVWYSKIFVSYAAKIPRGVPVIFASTHPNSAIDFILVAVCRMYPIKVMTRGDVFEKPALRKFFEFIWMLPVYRMQDGYSQLGRNQESFDRCFNWFDKGGSVHIFSEGICLAQKTLQSLKKGTARLALEYCNKTEKELLVVPVGMNYAHLRKWRNHVMINFGTPINALDFLPLYRENKAQGLLALNEAITAQLKESVFDIGDPRKEALTDHLLDLQRTNRLYDQREWITEDRSVFDGEFKITEYARRQEMEDLAQMSRSLEVKGIEDLSHFQGAQKRSDTKDMLMVQTLVLAPVLAIVSAMHALPVLISMMVIKKWIKDPIFYSTILICGSAIFYLVQMIVLAIIGISNWGIAGFFLPVALFLSTLLGIALVDDFLYGYRNWNKLKVVPSIRENYSRMKAALNL